MINLIILLQNNHFFKNQLIYYIFLKIAKYNKKKIYLYIHIMIKTLKPQYFQQNNHNISKILTNN